MKVFRDKSKEIAQKQEIIEGFHAVMGDFHLIINRKAGFIGRYSV